MKAQRRNLPTFKMVTFDPGGTTGWACFQGIDLTACGQFEIDYGKNIKAILDGYTPDVVVCENYKVYAHKISANVGKEVQPSELIGVIEYLCNERDIPVVRQMAFQAKGWAKDTKLRAWGLWQKGMKHSRDAIRHGLYFLFFGDFEYAGLVDPPNANVVSLEV